MSARGADGIRIERLTEARIPACWNLRLRALRDHPEAFGQPYEEAVALPLDTAYEILRSRWSNENSATFLAIDTDDSLTGMIAFVRETRSKNAHRGNIFSVFVVPEARGRGISRLLLDAALGHGRSLDGLLQVHLTVVATNVAAARSYERAGFVRYGRVPRAEILNGEPVDHDLMVLMLDGFRARFSDHESGPG